MSCLGLTLAQLGGSSAHPSRVDAAVQRLEPYYADGAMSPEENALSGARALFAGGNPNPPLFLLVVGG